jgi:hypothetical protein
MNCNTIPPMSAAEIERANSLIEFGQLELPLGHVPEAHSERQDRDRIEAARGAATRSAPRLASLPEEQS